MFLRGIESKKQLDTKELIKCQLTLTIYMFLKDGETFSGHKPIRKVPTSRGETCLKHTADDDWIPFLTSLTGFEPHDLYS